MTRPTYLVLGGFISGEWHDLWQRQQEWTTLLMRDANVLYLERAAAGKITPARILSRVRKLATPPAESQRPAAVTPFPQPPEFVSWVPVPFSGARWWRANAERALAAAERRRVELGWEPVSLVHVGSPIETWIEAADLVQAPVWFDSAERFIYSKAYDGVTADLMRRQVASADLFTTDTRVTAGDWADVRTDTLIVPHGTKSWCMPPEEGVGRTRGYYVGSNHAALDLELLSRVASKSGIEIALIGDFGDAALLPGLTPRGWCAGGDIPNRLSDAIAGFVPYVGSEWREGIFPSKVYDYLLAGAPVISTRLPALDDIEWVRQVSGVDEAVDALQWAARLTPAEREQIRGYALANTWETRFATVLDELRRRGLVAS